MRGRRQSEMPSTKLLAVATGLVLAVVAARAGGRPDATDDIPAGWARADFDLRIAIWASDHRVSRSFTDRNGNPRLRFAGQGSTSAFANVNSGARLTVRTDGSVARIALMPDGTPRRTLTGHNAPVWIPAAVPPGPAMLVHSGRVRLGIDLAGVVALGARDGKSFDACSVVAA
jgi:hypothetical protein